MVLVSKMDLYGPEHRNIDSLCRALEALGVRSLPISALTGQGLEELKEVLGGTF